jgi:hypothetical protein
VIPSSGGHFKAMALNIFNFIPLQFAARQEETTSPPHVPPWSRLLSNVPLNVEADFYLIVVSPNKKAATTVEAPHSSLYFFVFN